MSLSERYLDRLIENLDETYRPPPTPPREEMWSAIRTRRHGPGTGGRGGQSAVSAPGRLARRTLALAAGLLVAALVARWALPPEASVPDRVARVEPAPGRAPPAGASGEDGTTAPRTRTTGEDGTGPVASPEREGRPVASDAGGRQEALPRAERSGERRTPVRRARTGVPPELLGYTARRAFTDAELLLASVRREQEGGAVAGLAPSVGEVLLDVRLLLDSPLTEDPRLRELLRDLEVVLARIRNLRERPVPHEEWRALQRDLERELLLPRLRQTTPPDPLEIG